VNEIWKIKKDNWMQILQSDRWNKVLLEKIEIWEELWVKKEFIEDIWNRIHKESLEIEK
jgi:chorismate mutase